MFKYVKKYLEERRRKVERGVIQQSDQPWLKNLVTADTDDVTALYDWNPAFIAKLRTDGFTGETDIDVIKAWHDAQTKKRLDEERNKEREAKKNSDEPWVEIIGEEFETDDFDGQTNIGLKLDWNKAFIKLLKSKGFTGRSEDELVEKWLVTLNRSLLQNPETGYD